MKQKCALLSKYNPEDFDSSLKGVDFSQGIAELKKISSEKRILGKCNILKNSYEMICKFHPNGGADLHYPAFMYCVAKSNIPNLITEYHFILNLLPNEKIADFYEFQSLGSSIEYIKNIRYFLRSEKGELVEFNYFKEKFIQLMSEDHKINPQLVGDLLIQVAGMTEPLEFSFDIEYVNLIYFSTYSRKLFSNLLIF
jgi:hypothetical protein